MPTVLSDGSDHLSLNSLSSSYPYLPPPAPQQRTREQHFYHSYPNHYHPAFQNLSQHLSPGLCHGYYNPWKKPPPPKKVPPKTRNKPVTVPKLRYNHGPKWIHRTGLINGINYHWVETTSSDDDVRPTDKPLVVLLHGFPQFWYCWRYQIVPLADAGYRVVAPDLRGFNLTDKPVPSSKRKTTNSGGTTAGGGDNDDDQRDCGENEDTAGYDMDTLTCDIRALILHLGHNEANIVGHDWGGIIAWAFAARFPKHTTKLVVMNAPHLCRWRDVVMDYTSCAQQAWWICWYTLCGQLLPSWIPESILSYRRSWILTHNMVAPPSWGDSVACAQGPVPDGLGCASSGPYRPKGFPVPGMGQGGGCSACWKSSDEDLYRDAISKPGAIHALLEYYRNLWLSVQQMEQYGKIKRDLPILVLWGTKDKTFPHETYAQGWNDLIETKTNGKSQEGLPSSLTVSYLKCGHFTPEEAPEEVNQKLLDFFRQPLPLLSAEF